MYRVAPKVNPLSQPLSTCCWLTSLQMLFQWKEARGGGGKSESEILSAMDASPHLFPYYMKNAGIAPSECKETAKTLGLRWSGDGEFTSEILQDMLKNHGPLWVAGMWRMNSSHVIVVTACEPESGRIKYNDPWEQSGSESNGTISWLNDRGSVWKSCDASVIYWR
jgi:hypothetical protein